MAEECTESSVATSSPTPPYLWDLHASSLSSWNNSNLWSNQNPNSNSSCEEEVSISTSFTNVSNHSGLTVESSRRLVETASSNELIGDHASDNNLWSHLLLNVGSNGELQRDQDGEENFVDALSSKSMSTGIFEPACDYLKKLDNSWELTNSTSLNHFDKHLTGFSESILDNERLTKLSNQVSTWSIAPPHDPDVHGQFNSQQCNISLSSTSDHYQHPDPYDHMKQTFGDSSPCCLGPTRTSGLFSRNGQDLEVMRERLDTEVPLALLRGTLNSNGVGFPVGLNSSFVGDKTGNYNGRPNSCSKRIRSFEDVISFGNRIGKPLILDVHAPNFCSKSTKCSSEYKKQELQISSPTRGHSKGQGTAYEGKRKRSEDGSDSVLKKPKNDSSTSSSLKAPKVKLADRITALQQIVSPFGKTDTASVLFEAIQYITFLQEQVQLLMSNPYMKTNPHKDPWGGFDRKDKGAETKPDLRSRGLCLAPISCTPQIYRENAGSDYWSTTPAYRGCLYR